MYHPAIYFLKAENSAFYPPTNPHHGSGTQSMFGRFQGPGHRPRFSRVRGDLLVLTTALIIWGKTAIIIYTPVNWRSSRCLSRCGRAVQHRRTRSSTGRVTKVSLFLSALLLQIFKINKERLENRTGAEKERGPVQGHPPSPRSIKDMSKLADHSRRAAGSPIPSSRSSRGRRRQSR